MYRVAVQVIGKLLHCTESECAPIPMVENTTVDTLLATSGTAVTYTCWFGYQLPDLSTKQVITCLHDLSWSSTPDGCQGSVIVR